MFLKEGGGSPDREGGQRGGKRNEKRSEDVFCTCTNSIKNVNVMPCKQVLIKKEFNKNRPQWQQMKGIETSNKNIQKQKLSGFTMFPYCMSPDILGRVRSTG